MHRLAIDEVRAAVVRVQSADDLDERGLARAVIPEDARDFSGADCEIDSGDCGDVAEIFADATQLDDRDCACAFRGWTSHPAS